MKKALIVNQGLSPNLGDQAILESLVSYFINKNYKVDVAGFTHFAKTSICDVNYKNYIQERFIDLPILFKWELKAKNNVKRNIALQGKDYDYLVIGGGQLIKHNCYFPYALFEWVKFGKSAAKSIILIGIGIDPKFSFIEKKLITKSLDMVDTLIVRDSASKKRAEDIFGKKAILLPDVAFLLNDLVKQNNIRNGSVVMPFDYNTYKYHFNNTLSKRDYSESWTKLISDLSVIQEVILTYTTVEDKKETYEIFNALSDNVKKNVTVVDVNCVSDIMSILCKAENVYSARMHGLILGMICGAYVNSINISDKLRNFNKEYIADQNDPGLLSAKIKSKLDEIFI